MMLGLLEKDRYEVIGLNLFPSDLHGRFDSLDGGSVGLRHGGYDYADIGGVGDRGICDVQVFTQLSQPFKVVSDFR